MPARNVIVGSRPQAQLAGCVNVDGKHQLALAHQRPTDKGKACRG